MLKKMSKENKSYLKENGIVGKKVGFDTEICTLVIILELNFKTFKEGNNGYFYNCIFF